MIFSGPAPPRRSPSQITEALANALRQLARATTLALLVAIVFGAQLIPAPAIAAQPVYRAGDAPIDIRGLWRFRAGDDPVWADPEYRDDGWQQVLVPSEFGRDYGRSLIAWYRFSIYIDAGADAGEGSLGLALTLGKIDSAYDLYLGGVRVGGVGAPPPAFPPKIDYDRHRIYAIPTQAISRDGELVVALRVWNSPVTRSTVGGPHGGPFYIGTIEDSIWQELRSELHILFLAGLFLLAGATYLVLFRRRLQLRSYLWFAILCGLFALYGILVSQWRYYLSDDFLLLKSIEHITAFLILPAFVEVTWTASDLSIGRLTRLAQAICLAFALVSAVTPGIQTSLTLLPVFLGIILISSVGGTFVILRRAFARRSGSLMMAVGASAAALLIVRDVLITRGLLAGPQLPLIGFAVYLLFTGISLSQQMRSRLAELAHSQSERRALEHSQEIFRAISQQLPDRLYLIDLADGTIIHANTTTALTLGLPAEEENDQPMAELLDASTQSLWSEQLKKLPTGETIRFEGVLSRRLGATEPVEIAAKAIRYGGRRAALLTARDISVQKAAEQALRQSEIAADRANIAKSDFLANMSHEIRTPMTAILGILELVLDERLPSGLRKRIELVDTSARHLLELLNEILDFSKIEAGKVALEEVDFDLLSVVSGTIGLLSPRARKKGIKLVFEIKPEVPTRVNGDPARIRQVLLNLLTNALKFTEEGSVRLSLSLHGDDGAKLLLATVKDTGIGIAAEALEDLFTPFKQADTSTTRRFGGTGLGLAISKQIATLLGGHLSAESCLGEGSTFTFEWPLRSASGPPPERPKQALPRAFAERRTILVAEDNTINLMVISAILKKLGLDVIPTTNGLEALERLQHNRVDAVLMDCQMPEMDGYEATRQIRLVEADSSIHVPIIALTAHAIDGERERCIAAGMDDFISKPYRTEELRETLNRWLHSDDSRE